VIVSDEGQLGTVPSAARFKKDIKSMDNASESILALRPVKFQYKTDIKGAPQFGLVAEEVAAVKPGSGGARQKRRDLQRALRRSQHDVAQRVS